MAATANPAVPLTPKQRQAVRALLGANSVPAAARAAGVGEHTLLRWLRAPGFRAALAAEGELLVAATRRQLHLQDAASETFAAVLGDAAASPSGRVRAVQAVLDYLVKLRMLRDVEQRLTVLEEAQQRHSQW